MNDLPQSTRARLPEMCKDTERQAQDEVHHSDGDGLGQHIHVGRTRTGVWHVQQLDELAQELEDIADRDDIDVLVHRIRNGDPCDWFVCNDFAAFFATTGGWAVLRYSQLRKPFEIDSCHIIAGVVAAASTFGLASHSNSWWAAAFWGSVLASIGVAARLKARHQSAEVDFALGQHVREQLEQASRQ
jgi:hypothetical protein